MDIFGLVALLGGLSLFLYGMKMMGDGMAKVTGGRLERVLEHVAESPLKAVLTGTLVTALLQSSSAVTVMVVGFVNSGIMKLSQAVGIIMGANVGTTVTSWVLGLVGIQGDGLWAEFLQPVTFSAVLAIAGSVLLLYVKNERKNDIGAILVAFSIMIFGMGIMQEAVRPLAQVPEFEGMFLAFSNPFLGVIAGAVFTAAIRSSTASVAFLQALCVTGAVNYGVAVPILLGQNIGTCVTALISSLGASRNARRAAVVHLYFNVIGAVVFAALFYGINGALGNVFLTVTAGSLGIAALHTVFNVLTAIVLLPFTAGLERLARLTVKDNGEMGDARVWLVDERFLEKPAFAIEQSRQAAARMAEKARECLFLSMDLIQEYSPEKVKKIGELETLVDRYEDELGSFLIKLGRKNLTEEDDHTLSITLHCIRDFERIADHAFNIMEAVERMRESGMHFSQKAGAELQVLIRAVRDIVDDSFQVFSAQDVKRAEEIEPLEEVIDELNVELKKRHIRRLRSGECTIEQGFSLTDITTSLERVADHCSNIAICVTQVKEDVCDTHEYLDNLKQEDDGFFRGMVLRTQEKYLLP